MGCGVWVYARFGRIRGNKPGLLLRLLYYLHHYENTQEERNDSDQQVGHYHGQQEAPLNFR